MNLDGITHAARVSILALRRPIAALIVLSASLCSQSATGTLAGRVVDSDGNPLSGVTVRVSGRPSAFRIQVTSGTSGEFEFVLPYGDYKITAGSAPSTALHVYALQLVQCTLRIADAVSAASVANRSFCTATPSPFESRQITRATIATYPGSYSLPGLLLGLEPALVTQPLDYTGLNSMRLPVQAQRAFTWTGTLFQLQGMDATDPYQPGHPLLLPDVQSIDEIAVRTGLSSGASTAFASVLDRFDAQAQAAWHASLFTAGTGSAFASDNLPNRSSRNKLQQMKHFRWFTRDRLEAGTPLGSRADISASATGQWSSQTIPIAAPGQDQNSRLLFGHVRGHLQISARDQLVWQYTGSSIQPALARCDSTATAAAHQRPI